MVQSAAANVAMVRLVEGGAIPGQDLGGYLEADSDHQTGLDWAAYRALGAVALRDVVAQAAGDTDPDDDDSCCVVAAVWEVDMSPLFIDANPAPADNVDDEENIIPAWEAELLAQGADD
ncbi:hypothetical protein GZ998_05600 [Actinomyces sp. 594]|uniref:hypothetical protein n=1 Tax=Actinomyces sp. 594 TaxID=2057793 RepID=UPI001C594257|nr:hypothetical protein [Actinomyces sp. 594]MBW3068988.1 hypothetical protein [Actinomyces sp. 594]